MKELYCETSQSVHENTLTMTMLEAGSKGVVKDFVKKHGDGGSCRFVRRLKEIGLFKGAKFEIVKNNGDGEIYVACEGTTLALGRGMADKVYVELHSGIVAEGSAFGRFFKRLRMKCYP